MKILQFDGMFLCSLKEPPGRGSIRHLGWGFSSVLIGTACVYPTPRRIGHESLVPSPVSPLRGRVVIPVRGCTGDELTPVVPGLIVRDSVWVACCPL